MRSAPFGRFRSYNARTGPLEKRGSDWPGRSELAPIRLKYHTLQFALMASEYLSLFTLSAPPARGGGAHRWALFGRVHAGRDGRRTARGCAGRVRMVPAMYLLLSAPRTPCAPRRRSSAASRPAAAGAAMRDRTLRRLMIVAGRGGLGGGVGWARQAAPRGEVRAQAPPADDGGRPRRLARLGRAAKAAAARWMAARSGPRCSSLPALLTVRVIAIEMCPRLAPVLPPPRTRPPRCSGNRPQDTQNKPHRYSLLQRNSGVNHPTTRIRGRPTPCRRRPATALPDAHLARGSLPILRSIVSGGGWRCDQGRAMG